MVFTGMDRNSTRLPKHSPPDNKEIPEIIRQDLLSRVSVHQAVVKANKSLSEFPVTDQESSSLANLLKAVPLNHRDISAAADRIFSGPVRSTAIAIHLTQQCTRGKENAFSSHWECLHPEVRAGLAKALTDRLLVLRERAAAIHNASDADINQAIEELMQKLNALPPSVRSQLTDAILEDTLSVSPVIMINKLDMLSAEMPDRVEWELCCAMGVFL